MTRSRQGSRDWDPDGPAIAGRLWGLPFDETDAALVVLPVPWEATVSYGTGTANAPEAVLSASSQVDLYDSDFTDAWKKGFAMTPIPEDLQRQGSEIRHKALTILSALSSDGASDPSILAEVNDACDAMTERVRRDAERLLDRGKIVGVLGGDHSVPLGLMQALAARHRDFGVLHIDAHCDLRDAYEGFQHSHASIMHNALRLDPLSKLVQVGIRDYSYEERERIRALPERLRLFDARSLEKRMFRGDTWDRIGGEIVAELPEDVYVSFDIDGLDPSLCPGTGTPVPGGLGFEQALFLVEQVVTTGRRIIGFDLCEVSPGGERGSEWDANVGARVLYRLCCAAVSARAPEESKE